MDNKKNEVNNDTIDVKVIMGKIQETIRRRQLINELPPDPDAVPDISCDAEYDSFPEDRLRDELYFINANWNIHNNSYFISSHHPLLGTLLIKGRKLVNEEVRRYVDPVISKQTDFNANNIKILNNLDKIITNLENKFDEQKYASDQVLNDIHTETCNLKNDLETLTHNFELKLDRFSQDLKAEASADLETRMHELELKLDRFSQDLKAEASADLETRMHELGTRIFEERVDERLNYVLSKIDNDIQNKVGLANILHQHITENITKNVAKTLLNSSLGPEKDLITSSNYFIFEENFRGSRNKIKEMQALFLSYFDKCTNILDIGCGRGEFLELLQENCINGIGVDIDEDMVSYCHSRQLNVVHMDALSYLQTVEDKSLDGIFIDQFVEHVEPQYLMHMLALCYQKLKFGYYIIIETVNPLSLVSFINFYIDMSHKKPVHPLTLQFLLRSTGFRDLETRYLSLINDDSKLKKYPIFEGENGKEETIYKINNYNVDMLNHLLWGPMDYAVIGKK
jgi:2-polyprenyl-3-methyl-5-hydroxy-6-metoxy-1,4-benzoquinol methylase